jgi:16S rRNA (uracil1498-N3)-methyltransferase
VVARLRRTVIEASKQCGRNRLMKIGQPQSWPDFVAATGTTPCRLLAHPADRACHIHPTGPQHALSQAAQAKAAVVAVGPEGGFTPDELSLAISTGWQPIDLGPRVLRIETAAILLVARVVCSREPS